MQTIDALQESNQYIKEMQVLMQNKDWQGVIEDAKNKYEIEWPQDEEQLEDDPAYQAMWEELGGNKLTQKSKKPAHRQVKVQIN